MLDYLTPVIFSSFCKDKDPPVILEAINKMVAIVESIDDPLCPFFKVI